MIDLIASLMVIGLNRVFHLLPMNFILWLGGCFGFIVYLASGSRIGVTYSNLKAAFAGENSPKELRRLTREVYTNMAKTFAELLVLTKADREYIDRYIKVPRLDRIKEAANDPKGMILVSAHFGNWEMSTAASAAKGFPLYSFARDQKMKRMNELLNKLRERMGNKVIRKGADMKTVFRILKRGESLGILGDQNGGPNGVMSDLFGRPASHVIGPFRFAQKTGAVIIPAFIHRLNGAEQEVVIEEAMRIGKDEDIMPYLERFIGCLEKNIRRSPYQWLWMHKKWKLTTLKKIMVLDDGKKGHMKQSLAVVEDIKRYRAAEGNAPENIKVETIPVRYRSGSRKAVLNLLMPFISRFMGWHLLMLKWALEKESYERAVNTYADIVISCGSSLFGVNRVLKLENFARSLTVLDPGVLCRGLFNVIVMPEHDTKPNRKLPENIVVTDMAPNLVSPDSLLTVKEDMAASGTLKGEKRIGVLIGGDNKYFRFTEDFCAEISSKIMSACEQADAYAYVTTSRRTPERAALAVQKELAGVDRTGMFVNGATDTDAMTVEKILAASDIVMVSGESISMVSEAVSSGKKVIVFMPEKITGKLTKYESFVEELREKGYISLVKAADIPAVVCDLISSEDPVRLSGDDEKIMSKMYKLF